MLVVHKFPIPLQTQFTLELPVEHKVLQVAMQANEPMIWILVETNDTAQEICTFLVVGTGYPLKRKDAIYIGTFLTRNDSLVFHVFQIP